ncbi:MAG TPA: adenylate/guanylate cyclase domain-containing protein [Gaiellaceae bacterium]
MARISAQEVAELAPCELDHVGRLVELGILEPHEDELHDSSDVHLVRLVAGFEEAGIPLEDVARGISTGELSYPLGLFMPEPVAAPRTYAELGGELGRSSALLRRLSSDLGLPARADDRLREEDAELLSLIVTTLDLADDDQLSRFARLYGGAIQRLVTAGIQFFDSAVSQRAAGFDMTEAERDAFVYGKGAAYTELVRQLVPWLQRRHREHGLRDYLVDRTETWLEERRIAARPPRQPPAIAFLDLTDYTGLVEERGDEAAATIASDLASVVQGRAQAHGGRPVKWLGDGVMFHYGDPAGAVLGGLELVAATERAISVPARIGIDAGPVIVQEGDYFGRTVNVAARIADYAQPGEVLVSEEARQCSASDAGIEFELVGDVSLKGVSRPVRLLRAIRR